MALADDKKRFAKLIAFAKRSAYHLTDDHRIEMDSVIGHCELVLALLFRQAEKGWPNTEPIWQEVGKPIEPVITLPPAAAVVLASPPGASLEDGAKDSPPGQCMEAEPGEQGGVMEPPEVAKPKPAAPPSKRKNKLKHEI